MKYGIPSASKASFQYFHTYMEIDAEKTSKNRSNMQIKPTSKMLHDIDLM